MADGPWTKFQAPPPDSSTAAVSPSSAQAGPWTKFGRSSAPPPADTAPPEKKPLSFRENAAAMLQGAKTEISRNPILGPVVGLAETGIQAASAIPATIAAGYGALLGKDSEAIAQAGTYQPRTTIGQAASQAAAVGPEALSRAGHMVADPIGERSPAAGAAVYTATQMVPALVGRGVPKVRGALAKRTAPGPTATKVAPSATKAESGPQMSPEARAQDYVVRNTDLQWDRLSDRVKKTLTNIASESGNLEKLNPRAVERQARLESLPEPIKATRAQLERDDPALRREQLVSATDAGKPIREIYDEQNRAILKNLDILKGKVSGAKPGAATAEQLGQQVQDKALREKLAQKRQEVSRLYKEAEETGELQGRVSPRGVLNVIKQSPDLTHLGWVESWLNKMNVVSKTKEGGTLVRKLPLKDLEDLRQAAVARRMNGGTEGYYAGKVISAIDQATEGAGGKAYQAARKARREQALEFEEQGAVAQLVENKSRTDRSVALEDTWRKTVLGGSIEDIRKVKRSLMTGGTAETRAAGRQAWRDIRAQTIQHIMDEATKSVAQRSTGEPNITPASMQKAIRSIGPEKMQEIFGAETTRQVNEILQATRDVKTTPPAGHPGSSTIGNALALLEKGLAKVPVLGDVASGVVSLGAKAAKVGEAGRLKRAAERTPLREAESSARRAQSLGEIARRYQGTEYLTQRPDEDQ